MFGEEWRERMVKEQKVSGERAIGVERAWGGSRGVDRGAGICGERRESCSAMFVHQPPTADELANG